MAEGSAYTCISCRVAFAEADLQRAHYKSDWHRYNLKRKVADIPPVTAENFQQRVLAQRAQQSDLEKESQSCSYCKLCAKSFSSKNAYENHLPSKKHKEFELRQQKKAEDEVLKLNEKNLEKRVDSSMASEERREKDVKNAALKAELAAKVGQTEGAGEGTNTEQTGHGDRRQKVEMETSTECGQREGEGEGTSTEQTGHSEEMETVSEESWDGEALGLEECLFCSHVSKTMDANIAHMTRLHSFFIPDLEYVADLEGLVTYLGEKVGEGHICLWCNLKSKAFLTVKSVQQHMQDKGHCKMLFEGEAIFEYSDFYDYRKSYPDHTQSSTDVDMEEGEEELEVDTELLSEDNFQLVLPSGCTVGHRSLQRYYRQKLKPERQVSSTLSRVMAQYRGLGWTGTTGLDAQKRAKDVAFVQRMKAHHMLKINIKANKQQHFRDDNYGIRH